MKKNINEAGLQNKIGFAIPETNFASNFLLSFFIPSASPMLHNNKPKTNIAKSFLIFIIKFKLSLVKVIHNSTKCGLDVHVLIHF